MAYSRQLDVRYEHFPMSDILQIIRVILFSNFSLTFVLVFEDVQFTVHPCPLGVNAISKHLIDAIDLF